ncbi:MAG: hypothetical protein ACK5PS_15965 [Desulfopila sp.]
METMYPTDSYLIDEDHVWHKELAVVVSAKDKAILRELAKQVAEIAELPVQRERKDLWARMVNLRETRPMVWMCDICWNEMAVSDELTLQTTGTFCRNIEEDLRQTLFRWRHMPCDMVVEPVVYAPRVFANTGFGIDVQEKTVQTDADNAVVSHQFQQQIRNEDDIARIVTPKILYNAEKSAENFQAYSDIFDGILGVEYRGAPGIWYALWDKLITWTGIQDTLMDLIERPEYIHKLLDRLMTASLGALDQLEALNLLSLNNNNTRIGSGAYGYTDELPQEGFDPAHVRATDIWGCAADQILGSVSPKMHEEFAMHYDRQWLSRFGLTHYGCCEPLHNKIELLRTLPNLRRISISPWTDLEKAAAQVNGDYVLSIKVNPEVLARDDWHPQSARKELETKMQIAKEHNCQAEVIMKDISTVRHQPQRLFQWAEIAAEVAQTYG